MTTKDSYRDQRDKVSPPTVGLADLRRSHGMTQVQVAEAVAAKTDEDFYSGSLSLIEGGHRGASTDILRALEQVFGLRAGAITTDYTPSHSRRKKAS